MTQRICGINPSFLSNLSPVCIEVCLQPGSGQAIIPAQRLTEADEQLHGLILVLPSSGQWLHAAYPSVMGKWKGIEEHGY